MSLNFDRPKDILMRFYVPSIVDPLSLRMMDTVAVHFLCRLQGCLAFLCNAVLGPGCSH